MSLFNSSDPISGKVLSVDRVDRMIQLENIVLSLPVPKSFFSLVTERKDEGVDLGADWERKAATAAQEARSLEGNETDETERHH